MYLNPIPRVQREYVNWFITHKYVLLTSHVRGMNKFLTMLGAVQYLPHIREQHATLKTKNARHSPPCR
ncbi:hypothetical protein ACJMK2_043835, partial [Sinanodonta woodiana]